MIDIPKLIRRAKIGNLPALYKIYFDALHKKRKRRMQIQLDAPCQSTEKWSILRALSIRLVHILFARLNATVRTGSLSPLLQSQWDPITLEIVVEDELMGSCTLVKQSAHVFEMEVIGVVETKRGERAEREVVNAVKKYMRRLGATRIITRPGSEEMADWLKECGFRLAFIDDVLYFDL